MEDLALIIKRIAELESELRALRERARELGHDPRVRNLAPGGVAEAVYRLLKQHPGGMARGDICKHLGTRGDTISEALARLKGKGVVKLHDGRWKLCG